MISFLFVVSFLLHIVLLIIVFYLYQQLQTLQRKQYSDMEDMLNNFLQQLKVENQQLEHHLRLKNVTREQAQPDFKQPNEPTKEWNESSKEYPPIPLENPSVDQVETSLHSQVFHLHQKGLTTEEIAKQLNRGKTEIELIVTLNSVKE